MCSTMSLLIHVIESPGRIVSVAGLELHPFDDDSMCRRRLRRRRRDAGAAAKQRQRHNEQ